MNSFSLRLILLRTISQVAPHSRSPYSRYMDAPTYRPSNKGNPWNGYKGLRERYSDRDDE